MSSLFFPAIQGGYWHKVVRPCYMFRCFELLRLDICVSPRPCPVKLYEGNITNFNEKNLSVVFLNSCGVALHAVSGLPCFYGFFFFFNLQFG